MCSLSHIACWQLKLVHHDVKSFRGTVHHYYNGSWGVLCDEGWNLQSATVVCKQLGLGNVKWHSTSFSNYSIIPNFLLTKTNCSGKEDFLKDCSLEGNLWKISQTCSGKYVAEVRCEGIVLNLHAV